MCSVISVPTRIEVSISWKVRPLGPGASRLFPPARLGRKTGLLRLNRAGRRVARGLQVQETRGKPTRLLPLPAPCLCPQGACARPNVPTMPPQSPTTTPLRPRGHEDPTINQMVSGLSPRHYFWCLWWGSMVLFAMRLVWCLSPKQACWAMGYCRLAPVLAKKKWRSLPPLFYQTVEVVPVFIGFVIFAGFGRPLAMIHYPKYTFTTSFSVHNLRGFFV